MKLALLSDIHLDKYAQSWQEISRAVVQSLEDASPDMVIVAGDIAGRKDFLIRFFNETAGLRMQKIWVPGNHDLWAKGEDSLSSWFMYHKFLPFISRKFGWHYLPGAPIYADDYVIVGNPGWYNYTMRLKKLDEVFTLADYARKISPQGRVLIDRVYAKFGCDDPALAENMLTDLVKDLSQMGFPPSLFKGEAMDFSPPAKTVIAVSHFVPYNQFVIDYGSTERNYFNAFIGNSHIGAVYNLLPDRMKKVVLFGHTHHFFHEKGTEFEYICSPLGSLNLSANIMNEQITDSIKVLKV